MAIAPSSAQVFNDDDILQANPTVSQSNSQVLASPKSANTPSDRTTNVYVSYRPGKIGDMDFNGVELGYRRSVLLSSSVPIYIEMGTNAQYWFASEDGTKTRMFSLEVLPLGFSYKLEISDNVALSPHAGLSVRANMWGRMKNDWFGSIKLFDEDGANWRFWQLAWNVGLDLQINNCAYIGVGYGSDLQKMVGDERLKSFAVTLGIIL